MHKVVGLFIQRGCLFKISDPHCDYVIVYVHDAYLLPLYLLNT